MPLAAAVDQVPIVGEPIAYGMGAFVGVGLALSRFVGVYPLTLAHEGGHMLASVASLRRIESFVMNEDTSAAVKPEDRSWALSTLVIGVSGYAAPCLFGLGGAALVATGNPWGVLILGLVLSLMAIVPASNGLARLVPALVVAGIVWAMIDGTPYVQAVVAVGMVWYLLIGGLLDAVELPLKDGDAAILARITGVVPALVWKTIWIVIAVVCAYNGGRLLLSAP